MTTIWKPADRWVIGAVGLATLAVGLGCWLLADWAAGVFEEQWKGTMARVGVLIIGLCTMGAIVGEGISKWRVVQQARRASVDDEKAVRKGEFEARRLLRDRIRKLIARQDRFEALYRMPYEQQISWMTQDGRRFLEVIRDWKVDFDEYESIRSHDEFDAACRDVWPSGRDRAEAFNVIKARYRLHNHARYELDPQERERLALEGKRRQAEQDTDIEITWLESRARLTQKRDELFPADED